MSTAIDNIKMELAKSNFEFMLLDADLTERFKSVKNAEILYAFGSNDACMIKVRKEAEQLTDLIMDMNYDVVPERATFSERLQIIKQKNYAPSNVVDAFYKIKADGNKAAHVSDVTQEQALMGLKLLRVILLWYLKEFSGERPAQRLSFTEPKLSYRFKNNQERKLIYIQTADNRSGKWGQYVDAHKIGETTAPEEEQEQDWSPNSDFLREAARKRVNSYMKTSGIPAMINWSELAWIKSKKSWFSDKQVHEVLLRSGYKRHPDLEGEEWFQVDLNTAKQAIKAVKEGRSSLKLNQIEFDQKIVLRPEQNEAVKKAIKAFKKYDKVLWNAKMRFGKTLTTYQLIKEQSFKKVLVMTHRPVVSDSWFDDFIKINMMETGYEYGSKDKGELKDLLKKDSPFIYFASIQDLRGSIDIGGRHEKNSEFFQTTWDLIVIDEAHEGTQTDLASKLLEGLKKDQTKVLELSGTPFNILDGLNEDQVFTWDYIMEQQAKIRFGIEHPNTVNPYESLPEIEMYTFKMATDNHYQNSDKYFDFSEFFKVNDNNNFIYESAIVKWLDHISTENGNKIYPFSNKDYRKNIRHSMWLLPSRAAAKALKRVLDKHKVFKEYTVLNIVDENDDDGISDKGKDMERVRAAITDRPSEAKTIILTVRKLTTGVNIPELNAVVFLNNTTSAQNYLQAAFRAQTPFTDKVLGMKKKAYIFDFAPDRALNVLAKSVALSPKAGVLRIEDKEKALKALLNFLPVLEQEGNTMKPYSVTTMMRELKRAFAERAVLSGFDDSSIYNDNLWKLTTDDVQVFNQLQKKLSKTSQTKKTKNIDINITGLNKEELERAKRAKRKPHRERTPEELEALEKEKQLRKERQNMIAILRGVAIRIPLMIYGMDIDLNADVSLDTFVNKVDSASWEEFMPKDFTKADFNRVKRFFDADVFIEAGHRIRQTAVSANKLSYQDRIDKITTLLSGFKNPDKETVLTPWRVVNLHMGSTLGGYNFFDDNFNEPLENGIYREINLGEITTSVFNKDAKILEINSKTGLYLLYMAFSIYRRRYNEESMNWSKAEYIHRDRALWQKVLENNIFVLNKTPMARTITIRTLNGYDSNPQFERNLIYVDDLVNKLRTNIEETTQSILKHFGDENMKFDAVVGNPPYQESDGGAQASAVPIYQNFVELSEKIGKVSSLIMPSRWYVGGKGLDEFRDKMLEARNVRLLVDFLNPEDIFPNTNIRGGVCMLLLDSNYNSLQYSTRVITYENNEIISDVMRPLKTPGLNIFIRDNFAINLLHKVSGVKHEKMISDITSPLRPYGFRGFFTKDERFHKTNVDLKDPITCYGKGVVGYVEREDITVRKEWIDKWKIFTARANNIGTELNDDNFNTIIGEPGTICTETYIVIGASEELNERQTLNLSKYLKTKFSRYLHGLAKSSHDAARQTYRFVPFQNFTLDSDIDWSKSINEIDQQLYKKYGFDDKEIAFVEEKIKSM